MADKERLGRELGLKVGELCSSEMFYCFRICKFDNNLFDNFYFKIS